MAKKTIQPLPPVARQMEALGVNLKLARLRRRLSVEQVAERAGISRTTLWRVEQGDSGVAMIAYAQVLFVLGMIEQLGQLAQDDTLGRKLQDAGLDVKSRAPKRKRTN
jgi:transcriptional regulator with XRE-family HTH domain